MIEPTPAFMLADEAFDCLIAPVEPILGYKVLPDRRGIATAAQTQFDGLPERLAGAGGRNAFGISILEALNSTPNPVVTGMAGFEVSAFAFPLAERFSGLGLTRIAGFAVSEPVVTGMAGFAVLWPPGLPGRRTAIPAAVR